MVPHLHRSDFSSVSSFIVALGLAVSGCSDTKAETQPKMPPAEVSVAQVTTKPAESWNDFSGRLEAINTVELHPRVGGYINGVHFKEGSHVKKGELLFDIDPRAFAFQVTRLEAERRRAQSQLDLAKADGDRGTKLFSTGAISRAEYDRSSTADSSATASLDSIKASLSAARLDLEFTQVRAPIAGTVSRAVVTPGNLVSTSSVLTTLVSEGPLYTYFDVDEATFLDINKPGSDSKTVRVGLVDEDGYPRTGTVDFLDNRVDPRTGTVRARALIENTDGRLLPGLFARVRLVGGHPKTAMLIDDKAVMTDQDRKYVYVVDEKNTAQRKNIIVGRLVDGLRVAESGLDPKDRVVVQGVQKIFFPGMPVQAKEVVMGAPPADAEKPAGPPKP
jgi:multidrug efflux system membrane fusion protein